MPRRPRQGARRAAVRAGGGARPRAGRGVAPCRGPARSVRRRPPGAGARCNGSAAVARRVRDRAHRPPRLRDPATRGCGRGRSEPEPPATRRAPGARAIRACAAISTEPPRVSRRVIGLSGNQDASCNRRIIFRARWLRGARRGHRNPRDTSAGSCRFARRLFCPEPCGHRQGRRRHCDVRQACRSTSP